MGLSQKLLPIWARGEEKACSDVAKLLETARTRVGMPTPCPVNWSALCARQGMLLCWSFGSPFATLCELLTSAQNTGSQDQNNKNMDEHRVLNSSIQVNKLFYICLYVKLHEKISC